MAAALPPIPSRQPLVGPAGTIDAVWVRWLTTLAARVNGVSVVTAADIVGVLAAAQIPADVAYVDRAQAWTQAQSMVAHRITDLADPVEIQDAVTKNYVDQAVIASGLLFAVRGEVPTGTINGSNTVFTTVGNYGTTLEVFQNGLRQQKTADYTETTGTTFTFITAPSTGDTIVVNYADRGSGGVAGMVLRQSAALTGTTVDVASWQAAAYDTYEIDICGLILAGNTVPTLQLSTDGGATWLATCNYAWGTVSGTGATSIPLGATTTLATIPVQGTWNGTIRLFQSSGLPAQMQGSVGCHNSGGNYFRSDGGCFPNSTGVINALRLTGGTMSNGHIRIYGMTQS